jgi:lysine-N-methylase
LPQDPSDYATRFRCIGSACEDTCCQGWTVPIDQATFEKYRGLPSTSLCAQLDVNILATPECGKPALFAQIQMNAANQCPLLTAERLCGIQTELGEEFLSLSCAKYPRVVHSVAGVEETALALSCPEAARLVLLGPDLLAPNNNEPELPSEEGRLRWFWPIRRVVLALVSNRAYPLWQRLFLLDLLCRRLDSIAAGELQRSVPDFLGDFAATVATGALRPAMETLPFDREAQLDVVLRLAGMMLHRSNVRPRFVECVQAFTSGIGNGPGATMQTLMAQCALAHDRYYAPFSDRHPQILENYLVNTIRRRRFPFGTESAKPTTMARESALLAAQFALTKGFLIGVAGYYRDSFSAAHVVHTVQATSKHFEHHTEFLDRAYELLAESRMDGARGLSILLRDTAPTAQQPPQTAIKAPTPQVEAAPTPTPRPD